MRRCAEHSRTSENVSADAGAGALRPYARPALLLLTLGGAALGCASFGEREPRLIWNHSPSVPVGLYWLEHRSATRGEIVAIRPNGDLSAVLATYGALAPDRLLLKTLAASRGDEICREGTTVSLNGRPAAIALSAVGGRSLPRWAGCRSLSVSEIAVLGRPSNSFDSRYFGPIESNQALGVARPLLTFSSQDNGR